MWCDSWVSTEGTFFLPLSPPLRVVLPILHTAYHVFLGVTEEGGRDGEEAALNAHCFLPSAEPRAMAVWSAEQPCL